MKSHLKSLLGALPLIFALNVNNVHADEHAAHPIDPDHPIASLCQGDQKFTIARDNAHDSASITTALLNDLEKCAAAGYKNIIMERVPMMTVREVQDKYPDIKGKTPDQALSYFNEAVNEMENMVFEQHIAAKIEHIDPDSDEWKIAYDDAYNDFYATHVDAKTILGDVWNAIGSLEVHILLDKWYAHDPSVMKDDIRNVPYWDMEGMATPEEKIQKSQDIANIIIKTRDFGMRVHFYGDDPGGEFYNQANKYNAEANEAVKARETFITNNQDIYDVYQKYLSDEGFIPRIHSEMRSEQAGDYLKKLNEFGDKLTALYLQEGKLRELSVENFDKGAKQRFTPKSLAGRAKTFMEIAGDEKTLILWGGGHFNNAHDIDEHLGQSTRQIDLYPSRERLKKNQAFGVISGSDQADIRYFIEGGEVEILNKDGGFVLKPSNNEKVEISNNPEI